jgi:SPP1 gp7 family putative phage head morphogenesis protein
MTPAEQTAAQIRFRRQIGLAKRRRRMPRARYPTLIESDYAADLVQLIREQRALLEPLLRELPRLAESAFAERGDCQASAVTADASAVTADGVRRDVGEGRRARMLLDVVRETSRGAAQRAESVADRVARRLSIFQRGELERQLKAGLGIDLQLPDTGLAAIVEQFAAENVALVRSLGNRTLDDVEKAVTRGFTSGDRHETIAAEIAERYEIAERHARLIARDQVGKLNGQIGAARQQAVGITSFIWQTSNDERVRPEHAELEGKTFRFDDPPAEGLPGEAILCRCTAVPQLDDVLALLE